MRNTIFSSIEELRDFITLDISSDFETIKPYIIQAEKEVREITGDELFDLVVEYVNQEPEDPENPEDEPEDDNSERFDLLLPYMRSSLANFGYLYAIDKLNVNVGNTGITVASNNNFTPANEWRITNLKNSLQTSADDSQEELLKFLENNVGDYDEWVDSDAYSFQKKFYINNASEFFNSISKKITRTYFLSLREYVLLSENDVIEAISKELNDEIKAEILNGDVSENNQILLNWIKPAVCYLALSKKEKNEDWRQQGAKNIKQLRNYLNANAEDYPLYLASDCYNVSSSVDYNNANSGLYGFGI